MAPVEVRGAAMGVFHTSQFLGTFCGGILGGIFLERERIPLFMGVAAITLLWAGAVTKIGFSRSVLLETESV
jgi:predicted MFS family arabinose efflux permease